MNDTVIDFIRHGEPMGTCTYRGNGVDDPLSDMGWSQMWKAVGDDVSWDVVISSPMCRCRAFAETLSDRYALPLQVDERLKEVGFGSWEGRTREEIKANNCQEYEAFYQDPVNRRPRGAEPLDAFFQRVASACDEIVAKYSGKQVLIVTHAGVIRAVMAHFMEIPAKKAYGLRVDHAGVTRFRYHDSVVKLDFHNRLSF